MASFVPENLEIFLGVVRKYMQVRGPMSQKDLAEITEVGVSTMSRFLNRKTQELNESMIANIVAKLDIPLHEVIDFVDEEYVDRFKALVDVYKDKDLVTASNLSEASQETVATIKVGSRSHNIKFGGGHGSYEENLIEKIMTLSPRQRAYMMDFLDLEIEGRDLVVDIGNNLFRYFRQKDSNY